MKNRFHYSSYKRSLSNVPQVMEQMQSLQEELNGTELFQLQHFNKTYYIITKNVYARMGIGYFSDDELMKSLDVNFAKFYFDALKAYVENKETTPAWKITFDFCKENNSLPLIHLAQGVNAHVNNDLGLSLFEVVPNKTFAADYTKVNAIISASLDEVISEISFPNVYKPFMEMLIRRWRQKAWKNFINLDAKSATKEVIEKSAENTAVVLTKVHSEKDFYRLLQVI